MARLIHFLDLTRTRPLHLSVIGFPKSAARTLSAHAHHIDILEVEVNQKDLLVLQNLMAAGLPLLTRLSVGHRSRLPACSPFLICPIDSYSTRCRLAQPWRLWTFRTCV